MKQRILLNSILMLTGGALFAAGPHQYEIDPVHSGINFKVRHFFNHVPGQFNEFTGTITFDPGGDAKMAKAKATIMPGSVDTNNAKRDEHLNTEDYFHVDQHNSIAFESTSWKKVDDNHYEVTGNLTMLGQTHPVTLDTKFLGEMAGQGPYEGVMVAGWEAVGTIDRTVWGLTSGTPIVGDDVEIELSIQGPRPANMQPKADKK